MKGKDHQEGLMFLLIGLFLLLGILLMLQEQERENCQRLLEGKTLIFLSEQCDFNLLKREIKSTKEGECKTIPLVKICKFKTVSYGEGCANLPPKINLGDLYKTTAFLVRNVDGVYVIEPIYIAKSLFSIENELGLPPFFPTGEEILNRILKGEEFPYVIKTPFYCVVNELPSSCNSRSEEKNMD